MKKIFSEFPKEYENVYSDKEILKSYFKLEELTIYNDSPSATEYVDMFRETTLNFHKNIFDNLVKIAWLNNRFIYKNKFLRRMVGREKTSYLIFLEEFVNINVFFLSAERLRSKDDWIEKVKTYFKDFFPNFNLGNPFTENYEYPFKFMNFQCLYIVSNMPERMDLLKIGERRKMTLLQFSDYVLNYIYCYNDKYGTTWQKPKNEREIGIIKKVTTNIYEE